MIWRAGMLAVCVDNGPSDEGFAAPSLVEGTVYTVYGVGADPGGHVGLFLDEVESDGYAGGYLAWRFRPLNDAEDDTSLIARIKRCKPARKPVEA